MNLWAIQIKRKSHSREILSAKLVNVSTMEVTDIGSDMLMPMIKSGRYIINNLMIDSNGKLVLTNYKRNNTVKKTELQFHRRRVGTTLTESFVIVLGGYNGVYDVVFDIPDKPNGVYRMFGNIQDIYTEIKARTSYSWDNYNLFNAIIRDNEIWSMNNGNEFKIQFNDYKNIANIRNSIQAKYCIITYIDGLLAILKVKFNTENVEIPEGIELFCYSYGGARRISMPKSLKKIEDKAFKQDSDILKISINSKIEEIPTQFCINTSIQCFEYNSDELIFKIKEAAFYKCTDMKQIIVLPVKEIERFAFAYSGVRRVNLPYCSKISQNAFAFCDKLESVRIQDVNIIEEKAFEGCTKLSEIKIGSVKYIYKGAFSGCKRLKQVDIPKDTVIEDGAFPSKTVINRVI